MEVITNKEIGKAIKDDINIIEMSYESEAGKTMYKIKNTNKIILGICFTLLGIITIIGLPLSMGILGLSTVKGIRDIIIAGGGTKALNKLLNYKIEENNGNIILRNNK
jgi:hypothetical protein